MKKEGKAAAHTRELPCLFLLSGFWSRCCSFVFCFLLSFPFCKFPLSLLTLIKGEYIGKNTARDNFNLTLRNCRIVNQFLSSAQ